MIQHMRVEQKNTYGIICQLEVGVIQAKRKQTSILKDKLIYEHVKTYDQTDILKFLSHLIKII